MFIIIKVYSTFKKFFILSRSNSVIFLWSKLVRKYLTVNDLGRNCPGDFRVTSWSSTAYVNLGSDSMPICREPPLEYKHTTTHQKNIFAPHRPTGSRTARTCKTRRISSEKSEKKRIHNQLTDSYLQTKTINWKEKPRHYDLFLSLLSHD